MTKMPPVLKLSTMGPFARHAKHLDGVSNEIDNG